MPNPLWSGAVEAMARARCVRAGEDPDVPSHGPMWQGSPRWLEWSEEAADDIRAHHAHLSANGLKIVPVEATEGMVEVAAETLARQEGLDDDQTLADLAKELPGAASDYRRCAREMLRKACAAAPPLAEDIP